MAEIVEKAIRIDNRLQERKMERKGSNFQWIPRPGIQSRKAIYPNNYYGPRPMEIDLAQRQRRESPRKNKGNPVKYSKKELICYNYGKKEYFKNECRSPAKEYEKKKDKFRPKIKKTI